MKTPLICSRTSRAPFAPLHQSPFHQRNKEGFTLIELLTVIAIVAILGAILIPVVSSVRTSSHRTEAASTLRSVGSALQLYAMDNGGALPGPTFRLQNGYYSGNSKSIIEFIATYLGEPTEATQTIVLTYIPNSLHTYYRDEPKAIIYEANHDQVATRGPDQDKSIWGHPADDSVTPITMLKSNTLVEPTRFWLMRISNNERAYPDITSHFGDQQAVLYLDGHVDLQEFE